MDYEYLERLKQGDIKLAKAIIGVDLDLVLIPAKSDPNRRVIATNLMFDDQDAEIYKEAIQLIVSDRQYKDVEHAFAYGFIAGASQSNGNS